MKFFKEKGLKILDIEAGSKALIIKVEDQYQRQHFYGMPLRPYDFYHDDEYDQEDPYGEEEKK